MKNTNKILNLLTAFMAVIGVCAAVLVCFIIIYTNFNGGFSPKNNNTPPENITVAQTDTYTLNPNEIVENHTIIDSTDPSYSELSSFNEGSVETSQTNILTDDNFTQSVITDTEQSSSNISNNQYQATANYTNLEKNETIVYEHDIATDNGQSVEPVNRYSTSDLDISLPDNNTSESLTGIENNFNTYNNVDQQNTTDSYVLNTDSKKIHYPNCEYVKKIAPQNYSTSNLSVNELKGQGYTTCGICFK